MTLVSRSRFSLLAALAIFASAFGTLGSARAGPINGTLYYTVFSNQGLWKVDYNYNGSNTFSLSLNTRITGLPGADGLVFTTNGNIAVGGQSSNVYVVDPTNGNYTTVSTTGPAAFHMMADNSGHIFSSGIPGTPTVFNGTVSSNGTPLAYQSGTDSQVDTITYAGSQGFYTSSGAGGFGNFGKINIDLTNDTFTTQQLYNGVNGFHGMTYDPFTGDLFTFGGDTINQIDPSTGNIISSLAVGGGFQFDQGTVDGQGHLFIATNNGNLFFIDYSGSGLVGSNSYLTNPFLNNYLDDVAPIAGPGGSGGGAVPEPSSVVLLLIGGLSMTGYGWRSRRKSLKAAA